MAKIPGLPINETFSKLLKVSEITGLTKKHFLLFLETVDRLSGNDKYSIFKCLLIGIHKTELINKNISRIETKFLVLFNRIDKLPNFNQYRALFDLIISLKYTPKLWNKYYHQIKNKFLVLLNNIGDLPNHLKEHAYSLLVQSAGNTDLVKEPAFKEWVEKNPKLKKHII